MAIVLFFVLEVQVVNQCTDITISGRPQLT